MSSAILSDQNRNLVGAAFGALAGLAITLQLQHEAAIAALSIAGLILYLGQSTQHGPKTIALSGVLGLACTRLTIALIQ
ncbi:hypothetical protein [Granulicella arctica]|uniref:Uncharacterized protein n=1 Tax=Granulicella arctica TaxID=940613 RepID=A0A7Y9PJS9_9BACT|nr:hypothetical protein [Granulicella arctica]NYF81045.1 hypothetical protein [Granulicella arctica]